MSSVRSVKALTAARLRERLVYDPKTGAFAHACNGRGFGEGNRTGCVTKRGYVVITLDYVTHRAQRLAWLYMTGEWPDGEVDHIDGNRANNKWSNLRVVDRAGNAQNQRHPHPRNKAGMFGACAGKYGRYRARIRVRGQRIELGTYKTAEEAHAAYVAAKRKHHPTATV